MEDASENWNGQRPSPAQFKAARLSHPGLSQRKLARLAKVSRETIQNIESGKPSVTEASWIPVAEVLGLSYDKELCGGGLGGLSSDPLDETPEIVRMDQDAFDCLPWILQRPVQKHSLPQALSFFRDERDARNVIRKMRGSWHEHLKKTDSHDPNSLFGAADLTLNLRSAICADRYLKIWQRCPEAILCSTNGDERTGASVVLPVSNAAYKKLRAGECSYLDITWLDIEEQSQNLVFDTGVEFADATPRPWYHLTSSLVFAFLYQVAILSKNASDNDFRILSFGGSPTNIARLESGGFVKCPTRMPGFGFELYEFQADNGDLDDELFVKCSVSTLSARLLKRLLPQHLQLKTKRRLMLSAARAYQLFVQSRRPAALSESIKSQTG